MDDVTKEHNVRARKDAISESLERLYQLDDQIEGIIEAEVAPLRQDKTDIKAKLREDYNIPAKLLAARYTAYKLERKAMAGKDEATLDTIREMFEALPIGQQGDLFDRAAAD